MPNYNTQGITSADPRNLGGSEGYGNPSASSSSGLMSSTSNATANDDNNDEPSFFESIANLFSGAGADLPSDKSDDDGDSGASFYDGPMFAPYDGGSDDSAAASTGLPFDTTAADRAMYEALGVDVPEVYTGKMGEEEPEPNLDMDVLQDALQPEPITVEEIEVKAGDTLTAIAEEKGVPVQDVIDANPQIKNPDLIRPGEKVTLPGMLSTAGKLLKTATDPEAPAPVSEDPDREFYQSGIPIEDRFPPEADTGEGLMSDPRKLGGAEGYGSVGTSAEEEETTQTYSTTVESLYTDFTEGEQEGTEAHIGQDKQNITLPAGIVADGLKYDGKTVNQGSNTIKASAFDITKLDTSGAYKEVNGVKIKRSDYASDVEFSKAVLKGFEDVAKDKAGTDWDSMSDAAKKSMLKVGWNKGTGWLKGATAGSAYKELAKDSPSATTLYPKILTGSTLAPKKDGTVQGASIGIAKARADAMNALKDVLGVNEITKVVADNSGTNTAFKYYDSAGTLVHTEQTDRASSLYANKAVKVQKNSKGKW